MKKIIFRFLIILLLLISIFIIYLSTIGVKTDTFNNQISKEVKKINNQLELDLNKISIILDPFKFKLVLKTIGANLKYKNKSIKLESVRSHIDIKTFVNKEFSLSEIDINTRTIEIKNLISFVRSVQNSAQIFILEKFVKKGFLIADINLKFDKNGNIKDDFIIKGLVKDGEVKPFKKIDLSKINFIFSIQNNEFEFKDINLSYDNNDLKFPELIIIKQKNEFLISGNNKNKNLVLDDKKINQLLNNHLSNVKFESAEFDLENTFSFKINDKYKIDDLKINSLMNLKSSKLLSSKNLKEFFPKLNEIIELSDHQIQIKYDKDLLSIIGNGNIFIQKEKDNVNYNFSKSKTNLKFDASLEIKKNPFHLNFLNYKKDQDDKLKIVILGVKNLLSNEINLKDISIKEKNNKFEFKNLLLSNKYKIKSISKVNLNYFDNDLLKNELSIKKKNKDYLLDSKSFNAAKIIDDLLKADKNSESKKIFSKNFRLNIKIKEAFLDKDHLIEDLNGYLKFNDSEVIDANLLGDFSNNKRINFTIRSNSNEKITTLYSDLAKPFVNRYKFIKGFEEGNLDFHSIKQNNVSNSKLIIDNFKVQEVPALAKLLTLASLQGIADLLTGEGIRFTDFEMKFSNKDELMRIEELYAIGPAISLLMEGYIESDDLVSLKGTMVPATTINRTISSIPLLGDILVGKKVGEGVFGVSFKIKGPPKKLKTTVNPVKTLTPRFITRTLEKIKKN
ncbi:AsmA-like C-terminal region-containing protein [Candidatus Pelagibacter sp.]|nr:AsmA-like C-terminal region-containing protein [Candidatus Pelagibacter sp.]